MAAMIQDGLFTVAYTIGFFFGWFFFATLEVSQPPVFFIGYSKMFDNPGSLIWSGIHSFLGDINRRRVKVLLTPLPNSGRSKSSIRS